MTERAGRGRQKGAERAAGWAEEEEEEEEEEEKLV